MMARSTSSHWGIIAACWAILLSPWGQAAWAKKIEQSQPAPPRPALPEIVSIQLEPQSLTLQDASDARQVLVWGIARDGRKFDLSFLAKMHADSALVEIDPAGFISGQKIGEGMVTITAAGQEAKLAVKVLKSDHPPVRFTRDVMPMLSSIGCNAGTCHGSAKGKNGFKLSLRGYDPQFDYNSLVNELQGRRVNRVEPAKSLMLLKPTAQAPHEGGLVIHEGTRQYETILHWV